MARRKKVVSSNTINDFIQTEVVISQSEIIRKINLLDEKFTPLKAQKVIHDYIQDGGAYANDIQAVSKYFNKKNVRNLYIPLSIHGLKCDGKYILPVIEEMKRLGESGNNNSDDEEEQVEAKKTRKVKKEKDYYEIKDTSIGAFEQYLDSLMEGNEFDSLQVASIMGAEGSDKLKKYVEVRKEELEEDYEIFPELYTHIPKRMYNRIIKMMDEIIDPTSKANQLIKKVEVAQKQKAPRKTRGKPRNLIKALENFKYFKEVNTDLNLKSLHPSKIEGSKIAYLYDIAQAKIICMPAIPGTTLTIKGTTVYNVDETKSYRIAVRNFDKTFGKNREFNKTDLQGIVDKINSKKLALTTNRSNDNMVILGAF